MYLITENHRDTPRRAEKHREQPRTTPRTTIKRRRINTLTLSVVVCYGNLTYKVFVKWKNILQKALGREKTLHIFEHTQKMPHKF